jgi:hypothetical protein
LVKRNSKSKSIKKRYLGLRGSGWGSEGNRKTRNEVTRPKEGPIFEFKSRSQRQIAIAKANSKKQLYFTLKRGKSKGEKKRGA